MEENVTIIAVGAPYDFKGENGQQISGCAVWYIPTVDLKPVKDVDDNGVVGALGYVPRKETFPKEFHERIQSVGVPCLARLHYKMVVRNGQNVLKVDGCDFDIKK